MKILCISVLRVSFDWILIYRIDFTSYLYTYFWAYQSTTITHDTQISITKTLVFRFTSHSIIFLFVLRSNEFLLAIEMKNSGRKTLYEMTEMIKVYSLVEKFQNKMPECRFYRT